MYGIIYRPNMSQECYITKIEFTECLPSSTIFSSCCRDRCLFPGVQSKYVDTREQHYRWEDARTTLHSSISCVCLQQGLLLKYHCCPVAGHPQGITETALSSHIASCTTCTLTHGFLLCSIKS